MPSEFIAVTGALVGVLVGGLINYLASRSAKNREWRLALSRDSIALRQRLYTAFLVEADRLVVEGVQRPLSLPKDIEVLQAKLAELSLVAPQQVLEAARAVASHIRRSHAVKGLPEGPTLTEAKNAFVAAARADIVSFEQT